MRSWKYLCSFAVVLILALNVYADWEAIGPEVCDIGGYVQSLTDPGIFYCMAEGDTAYRCMRSLDHGVSWEYMGDCDCSYMMMYSFAIGPTDTLFVGSASELFISSDEGISWELVQLSGVNFIDIAPHPTDEQLIRSAGTSYGPMNMVFLCSTDGGHNWSVTPLHPESGMGRAIAVFESDPDIIYVGGYAANTARLYRSDDGGSSFEEISSSLWPSGDEVTAIAVDRTDPDIVFSGNMSGLYRSTDGGTSWLQVIPGTAINSISFSALDSLKMLCTYEGGVCRSYDGGSSWEDCLDGLYGPFFADGFLSRDETDHALVRNTAGLFQSWDFGDEWICEAFSSSYGWVSDLEVRPYPPYYLYAIIEAATLFESRDMGASWTPMLLAGDPSAHNVAPDPFDPEMVFITEYKEGEGRVHYTPDGGASWVCADSGNYWSCYDIEADPVNPGRYWVVGRTDPYGEGEISWTTDYGENWTRNDPVTGEAIGLLVSVDPQHPDTVYTLFGGGVGPHLARTHDAGASWSVHSVPELSSNYYKLIASPEAPGVLYAACTVGSSKVARSTDGGISWEGLPLYHTAFDLHQDPSDPQVLFAATNSHRVWISEDGGDTWGEMNWGLDPDTYIRAVSSIPGEYVFCGGTDDCCFRWHLPLGTAQQEGHPIPGSFSPLVFPNPSSGECTLLLDLPSEQSVRIFLFDIAGRRIDVSSGRVLNAGINEVPLIPEDESIRLPAGVYTVLVQTNTGSDIVERFVLTR